MQQEKFPEEYILLHKEKPIPSKSRLLRLSPMLDKNGLILLHGRTDNCEELARETKHPIILDRHVFTDLLVYHYHCQWGHQGKEKLINELRQHYWILQVRNTVNRIL